MDQRPLASVTLIVPFYRNSTMLARQVLEWNKYPAGVRIIVVDDGSPEPAKAIIQSVADDEVMQRIRLFRILVDIPWNREGARNLGSMHALTDWIVHIDIDHVLPAAAAVELLKFAPDPARWYRFPRFRCGRADETRRKDQIHDNDEFGQIHPHIDSYLVRRDVYWQTGGYDEDFAGCLGGGTAFLQRLEQLQPVALLPAPIALYVYTRDKIKDASDWSLSRDTAEGKRRMKAKRNVKPENPIRFKWECETL